MSTHLIAYAHAYVDTCYGIIRRRNWKYEPFFLILMCFLHQFDSIYPCCPCIILYFHYPEDREYDESTGQGENLTQGDEEERGLGSVVEECQPSVGARLFGRQEFSESEEVGIPIVLPVTAAVWYSVMTLVYSNVI